MKVKSIPNRLASRPVCSGAAAALGIWLFSAAAAMAGPLPDWMTVKPSSKLLMLALDAGVGEANGALNFNGHHDGSHKIVVPQGWTVVVRMKNFDARVPHSALVTRVYKQEEMPEKLGPQDTVFPGAATPVPFNGTAAGGYAEFTGSTPTDLPSVFSDVLDVAGLGPATFLLMFPA
jgi:hypothetical protein